MVEFANNIQNNVENEIKNSAEDSSSGAVNKVPNENENVAMFRGNRLESTFVSKNVINLSRKNLSSAEILFYKKDLNWSLQQAKLIKQS